MYFCILTGIEISLWKSDFDISWVYSFDRDVDPLKIGYWYVKLTQVMIFELIKICGTPVFMYCSLNYWY